ncbi:MAG: co-chaperone DjlA, partial [Xanthomonadales bacterium]|nr:co-chaperone DjlA [Xanthomonadales bacterium]
MFNSGHWIGKIIGFAIGMAKGGLPGAIFGAFLGHLFDSWRAGNSQAKGIQTSFFSNLFATLGHLAKADGHVSQAEINQIDQLMQRMNLKGEDRNEAIRQFNRGKQKGYNFAREIRNFARLTVVRPDLRHMFFEILVQAAAADGRLAPAEVQILRVVIKELRLPVQLLDE